MNTLSRFLILLSTFSFLILLQGCSSGGGGAPTTYTIGGTLNGLSGTLILQNNGGDDLTLTADGSFTFSSALSNGAAYSVTVSSQPSGQGCTVSNGSGSSSANVNTITVTCVDDADPVGYYENTGTALVKQSDNTTDLNINDMQAMIYNNRLMMMSVTNDLLYDGTMTISGDSYTATVTIYTNGQNPFSATISGTITEGSSITGDLTGTGAGNGSFSLTYATINNIPAAIARIQRVAPQSWKAIIDGSSTNYEFDIDSGGGFIHNLEVTPGYFSNCEMDGTVTALGITSLYSVSITITRCTGAGNSSVNGSYTGFITTQNNADTILILALANGSYSVSADFVQ